jgi:glutamine synthetase adenylyltransferase
LPRPLRPSRAALFKHLLPAFEKKTGIQVRVVALGTGQAIDLGRRGDADVAFVHDKDAEEKSLAEGAFVDALRGDVQRLRHRRAEVGSAQGRKAMTWSRA